MIGPNLRKALKWAAIAYVAYAGLQIVYLMIDRAQEPDYVPPEHWTIWLSGLGGLVGGFVQAGVLLVLLSIDERLERRE